MVLILGRFSGERKLILDAMRGDLRRRNLLPVIFDFSVPRSRDVTETVKVLAGLARFVIADVTDATEVRAELHNLVLDFTSLPVQPILLRGQREFVSLPHLAKFPWLLPTFEYDLKEHLLANLDRALWPPASQGSGVSGTETEIVIGGTGECLLVARLGPAGISAMRSLSGGRAEIEQSPLDKRDL